MSSSSRIPKRNFWTRHAWPPGVLDGFWAPLVSGGIILLAGGAGMLAGERLWIFSSLGPTLFLESEDADQPSAQIYNVIAGHMIGILTGYVTVFALGIAYQPSIFSLGHLTLPRVWAAVIALVVTEFGILLADASHPPAASSALLVALGTFRPTVLNALDLVAGVIIVAVVGEVFRRLRLGGSLRSGQAKR